MFEIVAMTREDALVISHWQYEGEYEMYNFEETQELLNELTDGSYFALRTRQGHGFYEGRAYLCPSAVSCRWLSLDSSLL